MAQQPFKIVEYNLKQLPCNIEAEQAVIASILVSNDIYDEISPIIDAQKFFDRIHLKLYETIEKFMCILLPITTKPWNETPYAKYKIIWSYHTPFTTPQHTKQAMNFITKRYCSSFLFIFLAFGMFI